MINNKSTFIKIKKNVLGKISADKLELFISQKIIKFSGKDFKEFRDNILPSLFYGISLDFIYKKYKKKPLLILIDKLKKENVLDFFSQKSNHASKTDIATLNKLSKIIWGIIDTIVIHQKEIKKTTYPFFVISSRYKARINTGVSYSWSVGTDENFLKAFIKSTAEAMERYFSSPPTKKKIISASFDKLREKAVDPRDIINYTEKQYKQGFFYKKFKSADIFDWVEVEEYPGNKKKLVIVDSVYYPLSEKEIGRKKYTSANSSGVAFHFSKNKAIEKSLYELIERDAFMILWLNRLAMPKVKESTLSKNIRERIKSIRSRGFSVCIFDITFDLSPVFLAVIFSKKQGFASFLGASSCCDTRKAVAKALNEAEALLYFTQKNKFSSIKKEKIKSPQDHGMYYRNLNNLKNIDFLLKSRKSIKLRGNDKENPIEKIKKHNMKLYYLDLSKAQKAGSGICVIRSFVPSLVPISFGYKNDPLGMKRIYSVPSKLGMDPRKKIETEYPHPFA